MTTHLHFLDKLMQDAIIEATREKEELATMESMRVDALLDVGNWIACPVINLFVFNAQNSLFSSMSNEEFWILAGATLHKQVITVIRKEFCTCCEHSNCDKARAFYVKFAAKAEVRQ